MEKRPRLSLQVIEIRPVRIRVIGGWTAFVQGYRPTMRCVLLYVGLKRDELVTVAEIVRHFDISRGQIMKVVLIRGEPVLTCRPAARA